MQSSMQEKRELLIAWALISIAFGIVLSDGQLDSSLFTFFGIAAIAVGLGFILHELAHKYFAQRFKCWAEFRSNFQMLVLALIMSFFGFIIAAPGAVVIKGSVTKKEQGIIAVAGPVANILLALLFLPLVFLGGFFTSLGFYGFMINTWLALFNMIPFGMFDGRKVWNWNKGIWIAVVLVAVGLYITSVLVLA